MMLMSLLLLKLVASLISGGNCTERRIFDLSSLSETLKKGNIPFVRKAACNKSNKRVRAQRKVLSILVSVRGITRTKLGTGDGLNRGNRRSHRGKNSPVGQIFYVYVCLFFGLLGTSSERLVHTVAVEGSIDTVTMILSVSSIAIFRAMFTILSLTVSNVLVYKIIRNAHEARRMSQENSKETLSLDQLLPTSDNDFRSKTMHWF